MATILPESDAVYLSPLPENPSLSRLGMKAARSEAEAESPQLFLAETTGFSPCVVHLNG